MNIITKSVIERMNLKVEPDPQSYITWVDKIAQFVTQRCIVHLQFSSYEDRVWCDVLAMDVANTFRYNGKKKVLNRAKPKQFSNNPKIGMITTQTRKIPLHLSNKNQFFKESWGRDCVWLLPLVTLLMHL